MGIFKKCDLHLHSGSCYSRNYTNDKFLEAVSNTDLDVIAITDHNYIDVDLLKELKPKLAKMNKKLIIGVELNVYIKDEDVKKYNLELSEPDKEDYFHAIILADFKDIDKFYGAVCSLLDRVDINSDFRKGKTAKEISKKASEKRFEFAAVRNAFSGIRHFSLFHEGKSSRNLSDYLPNDQGGNEDFKETLFYYNSSMGLEGGKNVDRVVDFFEISLNTIVTRLFFSDAKNIDEIGSKYTWIDFDGDLDSLNLAITDPSSRIKTSDVCETNPQTNENDYLEAIKFNLKDGKSFEIKFAPNYNGIIGSRGSGKSLLAYILTGQNEPYDEFFDTDDVKFKLAGGTYFKSCPRNLFLKQGAFEKIFQKDEPYDEIPFLAEIIERMRKEAIAKNNQKIDDVNSFIDTSKEAILDFLEVHPNLVQIDFLNDKKPQGCKIKSLKVDGCESNCLQERQRKLAEINNDLTSANEKINGILQADNNFYPETEPLINKINEVLNSELANLNRLSKLNQNIIEILNGMDDEPLETHKNLIKEYSALLKGENQNNNNILERYEENADDAYKYLEDLLKTRITVNESGEKIKEIFEEALSPVKSHRESIAEVDAKEEVIEIQMSFDDIGSFDEFVEGQFKGVADNEIEKTLAKLCLHPQDTAVAKKFFNGNKYKSCDSVKDYLEKYYNNLGECTQGFKKPNTILSYNGKNIASMSPGTRAQILLKLFLHQSIGNKGYKYIVLDQPEDNLDTKTITETLVELIKEKKQNIQLFVVSHSAPVVINGDARTIIVCEERNGNFEYRYGAVNDANIKEDIVAILDGGEAYLKMRLYKYDFQKRDLK